MAKKNDETVETAVDAPVIPANPLSTEEVVVDSGPSPEALAVEAAEGEVAAISEEIAKLEEKKVEASTKVEEAKVAAEEAAPPKTYFVYDRDTVLEATVLKEHKDGAKDLECSNVLAQKFVSGASSGTVNMSNKTFLRVRPGSRGDVGSFFVA
jgi:hypothetical protein